ncbi:MAG: PfkB family carbohydrate kinase [Planctomycetota bacterium]|jgi:ribokinase
MANNAPKLTVIGGTYIDLALKCTQMPAPGQHVKGSTIAFSPTGPGTIQAVQAALCGCDVHLVSKVGDCPFGKMLKDSLAENNINTDYVFTAKAKHTGAIVTIVDSAGENASCTYIGANSALIPKEIQIAEETIANSDACLIHGQLPQDAICTAIRLAKIHSTKLILNPARPLSLQQTENDDLPIDYFSADILILNLFEAAHITDHSTTGMRTAKLIGSDLIARGAGAAVITMSKRGCMVVDRNGADHIPAFEVELVNKTARGDAFAAALASYCAIKDDIREAAKFAAAAGALTCTKFGDIEALPTKQEIIQLLQQQDFEQPPVFQ